MAYHLFSLTPHIARKQHRCIWCYEPVVRGEVYYREASIFEGRHQNFAWHWDCYFDAQAVGEASGEWEFISDNERPPMLPFRSMEAV